MMSLTLAPLQIIEIFNTLQDTWGENEKFYSYTGLLTPFLQVKYNMLLKMSKLYRIFSKFLL